MDGSGNWLEHPLAPVADALDNAPVNPSNPKGSASGTWCNSAPDLKPYIESSSSSTTHISENICISKSVSLGENFPTNINEDDEWNTSLESCFSTLGGSFEFQRTCPKEASGKESLEEQLNSYFSRTFGDYVDYANIKTLSGIKGQDLAGYDRQVPEPTLFVDSEYASPDGTVIFPNPHDPKAITSIESTECAPGDFFPIAGISPSSTINLSDHANPNPGQYLTNGFNTPEASIDPFVTASNAAFSINGNYSSCAGSGSCPNGNVSISSNISLCTNLLGTQFSASLLGEPFPNTLSDIGNESYKDGSYEALNHFEKDMFNRIDEPYYKTLRNSNDLDLIFNNMDSMSRVDNLLNKDTSDFSLQPKDFGLDVISDYHADILSSEMLNNDALFAEIYRDNDTDECEIWDSMMKKLRVSNQKNIHTKSTAPNTAESSINFNLGSKDSEPAIVLKNTDNLPSILPSDPNLGFKKTSLCKYWQRGICANDDCNFAHGKKELRSTIGVWRTTICHHWKTGICRVGKDCRHAHGEEELQPKNIPANVLKNKLLNSARKYEYMRKKKSSY